MKWGQGLRFGARLRRTTQKEAALGGPLLFKGVDLYFGGAKMKKIDCDWLTVILLGSYEETVKKSIAIC